MSRFVAFFESSLASPSSGIDENATSLLGRREQSGVLNPVAAEFTPGLCATKWERQAIRCGEHYKLKCPQHDVERPLQCPVCQGLFSRMSPGVNARRALIKHLRNSTCAISTIKQRTTMAAMFFEECPSCHNWYTSVLKHKRVCPAKDHWPYCSNIECCEYATTVTALGLYCDDCDDCS